MSEKLLSNGTYFFKGEGGGSVTYTGGDYIEITDQNVINATGLQPAGDYATKSEIPSLDNVVKTSDLTVVDDEEEGYSVEQIKGYNLKAYRADQADFAGEARAVRNELTQQIIWPSTLALKSEIPSTENFQPKSAMSGYSTTAHGHDNLSIWDLSNKELDLIDLTTAGYGSTAKNCLTVFNIRSVAGGSAISGEPTDKTAKGDFTLEQIFTRKSSSIDYVAQQHLYWRDKEWTREVVKDHKGLSATDWAKVLNTSDMSGYVTTSQLTGYYPITGGNVNGKVAASGVGSAASEQAAVIYAKVTNTNANNQAGLGTNGSVLAGDYNNATSQTIGVRRKVGDKKLAGRFQLYSDGNVSFQQIENTGSDSIVCQLQYGNTTAGDNWGTMTFGSTTKHIAFEEDLSGSYVKKTDYDNLYNMLTALSAKISASWTLEAGTGIAITNDETNKKTIISKV